MPPKVFSLPTIKNSELSKLAHVDVEALGLREISMCPIWDGENWELWTPLGDGTLVKLRMIDSALGAYLTKGALAAEHDLHFTLLNFVHQRLSFPEVRGLIGAVVDDFHMLAVTASKLQHFADHSEGIERVLLSSFVRSELEGLLVVARSVFDLSYEIFSKVWNDRISLIDASSNAVKRRNKLPKSFRKFMLLDEKAQSASDLSEKYALPIAVAEVFAKHSDHFLNVRKTRDDIVHRTRSVSHIYVTERGFAVDPKVAPYKDYNWQSFHYENDNIVTLKPWVARWVLGTLEACSEIVGSLSLVADFGPDIFPGYEVRLRDPSNKAIVDLLNADSEDLEVAKASAFWRKE